MNLSELGVWPGIKDRVALVTGGSRGIGQAIVEGLGHQGANVIGTATSSEGAEKITKSLGHAGFKGMGMVLDVSNSESVETLFLKLKELNLVPTILVNNAGITRDNLLMRMKEDE